MGWGGVGLLSCLNLNLDLNDLTEVILMSVAVRRLGLEISMLSDYVGQVTYEKINTNVNGRQDDIRICFSIDSSGISVVMCIDHRFPFSSPYLITINDRMYESFLKNNIPAFKKIAKEYAYPPCFCCVSVTCPDKWGPSIHLKDLVSEITEVIKQKQHIMHIYFCRQVACECLTYDIPLERYLSS